jgi:hypothetical protein
MLLSYVSNFLSWYSSISKFLLTNRSFVTIFLFDRIKKRKLSASFAELWVLNFSFDALLLLFVLIILLFMGVLIDK